MTGVMSKTTVGDSVALEGSDFYVTGYTDGDLSGQTLTGTRDVFVSKNFCKPVVVSAASSSAPASTLVWLTAVAATIKALLT